MAGVKGVRILIDGADLETLKDAHYRLCFAKKVDKTYNVVWQSYDKYLSNNGFDWTPKYELFGINEFEADVTVVASTNEMPIELNETATLNSAGNLDSPSTGGDPNGITMINQYGPIHPGLNQLSDGVDGSEVSTPIYVAEDLAVLGKVTLTPVELVQVWFEQDIETSTMFSDAISNNIEIDLTNSANETRLYKDGVWSKPTPEEVALFSLMPTLALKAAARPAPVSG